MEGNPASDQRLNAVTDQRTCHHRANDVVPVLERRSIRVLKRILCHRHG